MAEARRFKKNPNVSWRTIDGQAVLIFNKEGEIQVLNEVGTYVWEHSEEDLEETVRAIVTTYSVSADEASRDVREFVDSMLACGALQPEEP